MKNYQLGILKKIGLFIIILAMCDSTFAQTKLPVKQKDSIKNDSLRLRYPFKNTDKALLYLDNVAQQKVIYDAQQNKYFFIEKIGDYQLKYPVVMSKDEYKKYRQEKDMIAYFKEKVAGSSPYRKENTEAQKDLLPTYYVNSKFFKTIFGGNTIEVAAQGSVEVSMGVLYQNVDNPQLSERNRSSLVFDFDQQIGASVMAKIGTRLELGAQYDTKSTFDFQNRVNLGFEPDEDDILRKIEVGNVSMPLKNSLIVGAQSLFGLKTQLQFGPTMVTSVFAQQRSQMRTLATQGGSKLQEFELRASDYDDNRHFFLSHYFRDTYDKALLNAPLINSSINITKVEVWVTNRGVVTENVRNIVAIADIAETNVTNIGPANVTVNTGVLYPDNDNNNISNILTIDNPVRDIATVGNGLSSYNMQQGRDYSVLENAKRLNENEFTVHPQLGYISLNRRLGESDVLAVAFEYTISGSPKVYRVGEFSSDGVTPPKNLVVKLLRSEILNTNVPLWNLMMKNIYSLQTSRINGEGLRLELLYANDETGVPINTLQNAQTPGIADKTIMNITNIDRLDESNNYVEGGNGYFDYVERITADSERGYIIFPVVEPFGKHLKGVLTNSEDENFIFNELYTMTQYEVKNDYQTKDKYLLKGYFKGDGSMGGIPLGAFNVPRGSVRVTSGGRELMEGVDYVVDYSMGRVQIINPALEGDNVPIQVSVENNEMFSLQNKRFIGIDVEHKFSENFIGGVSFLNLKEKPFTQKVAFGNEPINNTIVGLNASYGTEVPFLTKLINKIPTIDTEVPSRFSIRGDFAYLKPGSPSQIELQGEASSYIDDFEGTHIPIEIRSIQQWQMASTPQYQANFDFNGSATDLSYGYKRARLAWYIIDPIFYGSSLRPKNINNTELSRAEVRSVSYRELFPEQELDITQSPIVRTFDLAYFPHERGSYNYDTEHIGADGKFTDPEERWAGITRALHTTNFEQSNVEYIQFWLMDPFQNYSISQKEGLPADVNPNDPSNQVGEVYFNLGSISEDVLKDGRKSYENGLPKNKLDTPNIAETAWGIVPTNQSLIYTFDDDDETRKNQDIGLDGLDDEGERKRFGTAFGSDPSNDNYSYFRSTQYDQEEASIITRYKKYNNTQGNSPTNNLSTESYPTAATSYPDVEDLNRDQTMNTVESYYQYKVSLNKEDLVVGKNHIVDEKNIKVTLPDGSQKDVRWLQFRVQVSAPDEVINDITGFHSIRFMRIFLTKFKMPVVLRFGELKLVRGDWRRYTKVINNENPTIPPKELSKADLQNFESGVVNIQENERRTPIPYVLPPGVVREILRGNTTIQKQNEQSISLRVKELKPKETRAVFKNTQVDLRMYKKLKLFLHAEGIRGTSQVGNGDIKMVFRLGSDLTENYYQIEKPLVVSDYSAKTPLEVWPEENNLSVLLEHLGKLKLQRLASGIAPNVLYPAIGAAMPVQLNGYEIRVKGNPNLANIRTMMLGVKNASSSNQNVEVWMNEMRVSEFDNEGGWAAVVSADANLADFANISVTGRKQTKGFGNVEQSVNERSQEDIALYDVTTSVNAGQLLPKKWGLKIPVNYSISEEFRDPKYDPQYQDVLFKEAASINPNSKHAQDYTRRRSVNIMNLRKDYNPESERKKRFYDVENLSVSYSFSELYHKDYNIQRSINKNVRAMANYTYSFHPKNIQPFKNWKAINSKYFRLIKDFNFNLYPSNISIGSTIFRNYNEQLSRTLIEGLPDLPVLIRRDYRFDWNYNIAYDLTKALQLNFQASNNYLYDDSEKKEMKLYDQFFQIGTPMTYNQQFSANYKIPIDKLPFLDFVRSDLTYTADYNWQGGAKQVVETVGNTIQNANTITLNTSLNFNKLYKSVLPKKLQSKNANGFVKSLVDVVTSVKNMRINYTSNSGTMLSGFKPSIGLLGRHNYNGSLAPTLGFVFGSQVDIRQKAVENGWLISRGADDPYYNQMYSSIGFDKLDVSFEVKPFRNFTVEFQGMRTHSKNTMQQLDVIDNRLVEENPTTEIGSFSISTNMLGSTFKTMDVLFNEFKNSRSTIAQRLATETGQSINGFGESSPQVIIPAFMAAYTGKGASGVSLSAFRKIPIPGWNLSYRGLMKFGWFKENFRSFSVSHKYQSLYTIAGYNSNLEYNAKNPYLATNISGNYFSKTNYNNINLIEEYSPLIKLDMKMKNSVSLSGRINKDRALMLSLGNNTITQETGTEYVLGVGYRFADLAMKFRAAGRLVKLKGDLNIKADLAIRNNRIVVRSIEEVNDQVTGGQQFLTLDLRADYAVSKNFIASLYFKQTASKYAISTTFPRQSVSSGLRLRYIIGNN